MKQYSGEFKANIIAKVLAPNNVGFPQLARETGIPKDTLYTWRIERALWGMLLRAAFSV